MFEAGLYFPNNFFTNDPGAFTRTLLADLVAKGGRLERTEVVGFGVANRRVERVRTRAAELRANAVVLCAGPWSRGLLRQLGTDVPLEVERGYITDLPNAGVEIATPFFIPETGLGFIPFTNGRIRIGAFDELSNIKAPADPKLFDLTLVRAKELYPRINTDGAVNWMRQRPSLPDSLPIVDRAPKVENVFLNFGHGHKGFTTAAITGKLIAELMDGRPTSTDLHPFRATRFAFGA